MAYKLPLISLARIRAGMRLRRTMETNSKWLLCAHFGDAGDAPDDLTTPAYIGN